MRKSRPPTKKKERERKKKNYFKMEVTSNNTKSKLMMDCIYCTATKIVWILGFVSLSHEFLVFWLQTEIMLLGLVFCFGFFFGIAFWVMWK
jgi:hypothetical protein